MLVEILLVHLAAMASPGPNVLLVTRTASAESRRAGLYAAAGVASGATLWAALAAAGLALVEVPFLRDALRVLGGAYLVFLGLRTLRWAGARRPAPADAGAAAGRAWRRGVLTNLSNPKAAIFFLSIFATLLPPAATLGLRGAAVAVIAVDALLWHGLLAVVFSTRRAQAAYLRRRDRIDRIAGIVMAAFGASYAVLG